MWQDPGTWIALGVSAVFVIAGVVMHRVFVRILKNGAPPAPQELILSILFANAADMRAAFLFFEFRAIVAGEWAY